MQAAINAYNEQTDPAKKEEIAENILDFIGKAPTEKILQELSTMVEKRLRIDASAPALQQMNIYFQILPTDLVSSIWSSLTHKWARIGWAETEKADTCLRHAFTALRAIAQEILTPEAKSGPKPNEESFLKYAEWFVDKIKYYPSAQDLLEPIEQLVTSVRQKQTQEAAPAPVV